MSEAVITLNGLAKRFAGMDKPAVAPLDSTIHSGHVTGLVGPDGAGKTTLMRMLAGLLKADGGSASVLGFDPIQNDSELHAVLGYMPQKFGLYEDLTVMENLNLYADLRSVTGEIREKTFARLLEFTALGPFTGRLAGKLSGGMKQKLGLACTLVGEPKVLLLDEPGVGVDPISRRELWQMVHELAGDGMLILWSTSYLDEAEQCRDVLLMNEGELLYQGEPKALTQTMAGRSFLMSSPQENNRKLLQRALRLPQVSDGMIQGRSVRLILKKEATAADIRQAEGMPQVSDGMIQGRSVRLILKKEATAADIRQAEGMPEITLNETAPRFEDAFIDLLGGAGTSESPLGSILHTVEGTAGETVIEAQELTKKFGDFAATDHVNFVVQRGEIFGLLGPNGAGKSTTFKMMCGLLVPTSGKALVLDMDLKVSSGKARQHLGYMAQKFSLYGNLTVEQNLRFFSGVYGLRGRAQNEKIQRMSEAFGLKSIASHPTDALPLGFKQRLALACSLMHEPDILFLDEPTSGVDPLTRREFWLHINSMVEKGVTVMVTTHFMDEAEYCDRIGLVYRGKLIASGTPDDLKAQAADEQQADPTMEQAFITLINDWDKEHTHE
ncbi:ABC transporter ATP-binding protein [Salmonella enterica]|nr:ABC transporter ATP-binding protein [Salmonella enterica]